MKSTTTTETKAESEVPERIWIAPIGLQCRSNATIYSEEQSEHSDVEYRRVTTCKWTWTWTPLDDYAGYYDSDCGNTNIVWGDSAMAFCSYCGGKLEVE